MSRRVYIAGPMTGLPDFNYPAFKAAAKAWRAKEWTVFDPTENFDGDKTKDYREYIRADLKLLMKADAIAFLPGWEKSNGALFEAHVAHMLGLNAFDAVTSQPLTLHHESRGQRSGVPDETILEEAQRLVHGDRGAAYGHPAVDYARTGRIWGALLGIPDIEPRIACLMMVGVKLSREVNSHKRDNLVDAAGYAECAQMIAERAEGK